jgi:hypothetical protein
MPNLKIVGVPPFDGEYPISLDTFNGHELHTIKQISGVRGGELMEALNAGDYDLLIAFAVIGLRREGKVVHPDQLLAADLGAIRLEKTAEEEAEERAEAEQRPPSSASPSGSASAPADSDAPNGGTPPSGPDSSLAGGPPPSRPSLTGLPGSATTATSGQETLAS